jgi:hypothetical protein
MVLSTFPGANMVQGKNTLGYLRNRTFYIPERKYAYKYASITKCNKFESQHSLSPTIWSDIVVGRESGYLKIFFLHFSRWTCQTFCNRCIFVSVLKEKFVNHQALVTLANWKIPPLPLHKSIGLVRNVVSFILQQYLLSINDFIKVL